jgi:hypothetical protein
MYVGKYLYSWHVFKILGTVNKVSNKNKNSDIFVYIEPMCSSGLLVNQ